MNDPVLARIAREDPAENARPATGDVLLMRLRREIEGSTGPVAAHPGARRRRGQFTVPVLAALVTIAVAVATVGLLAQRAHRSLPTTASPAHPLSAVAVGSVALPPGTETLTAHDGSVWASGVHSLARVDAATGAVQATIHIPLPGLAVGLTFGAGSSWAVVGGANTLGAPSLARIDPTTGRILATIGVTGSSRTHLSVVGGGIAFAAGRVWLSRDSSAAHGEVVSVNPATDRPARRVDVGTGPTTVLAAFGSLWVQNTGRTIGLHPARALPPSVTRIDPITRQATTEPFAGVPSAGFGSLWIRTRDTITRYDPLSKQILARIPVPRVAALAFGAGRVWAVSGSADRSTAGQPAATLTQIDPRADRIVGTVDHLRIAVPVAIAVSGRELWIADYQTGLLHFRLSTP